MSLNSGTFQAITAQDSPFVSIGRRAPIGKPLTDTGLHHSMVFGAGDSTEAAVSKRCCEQGLDKNGVNNLKLSEPDFTQLEQLVKSFVPLKELSDFLAGDKYVTGSCVAYAVYKLKKYMVQREEDPMYITSIKKAFASYFNLNIRVPPVLKKSAAVDPRFKKLSFLSDVDKDQVFDCILNEMILCYTSSSTD